MLYVIGNNSPLGGRLLTALCDQEPDRNVFALNFELPTDGEVPDWIQLLPAGPDIVGRDGRNWTMRTPEIVVEATRSMRVDLPLDWEHATQLQAPEGNYAPAAAWITQLEVREGAIWGKVGWTESGKNSVASGAYRYYSPVFKYDPDTGEIVRLVSAGLTNAPNLFLEALNREERNREEDTVKLDEKIRQALGLSEGATVNDGVNAINQIQEQKNTALNQAQNPSLEHFVPRSDYDTALNRAQNAEQKLQQKEKEDHEAKIETAINQALEEGKITPATKDYHWAQCRQEGGLERFQEFVSKAPAVGEDTDLDGRDPDGGREALNAEQKRVAELFGNTEEDLQKYGT